MNKSINPKIAIVGRPNVGKSSLFNRIVGSRRAIVESASGTTRDRLYADVKWKGKAFTVVDTGGFEAAKATEIARLVLDQLNAAIKDSDIIFFVNDASSGIMPQDIELAARLRKTSKRIYLIVNKVDDKSRLIKAMEFFELGLGDPYSISTINGTGIEKLLDDVASDMERPIAAEEAQPVKVAIVGRPNVGKSSFLNSVLKEERVIVHPIAGTTRDSVDTDFIYKDRRYVLIDTAGIRHDTKIKESADFYGSVRSKEAIKRCDAAIVLIDGFEGLKEDDSRIIDIIIKEGKALIIAVNKWDLNESAAASTYGEMLIKKMNAIRNYPVVFISAKTGRNVNSTLAHIWPLYEKSKMVVGPEKLSELRKIINNLSVIVTKRIKFEFMIQKSTQPPTFVLGVRDIGVLNQNTKGFVENFFRKEFDLTGIPVRIIYSELDKQGA